MGSQRKKNTHIAQPTCRMARREMVINLLDSVFVGANQTRCGVCVCVRARKRIVSESFARCIHKHVYQLEHSTSCG